MQVLRLSGSSDRRSKRDRTRKSAGETTSTTKKQKAMTASPVKKALVPVPTKKEPTATAQEVPSVKKEPTTEKVKEEPGELVCFAFPKDKGTTTPSRTSQDGSISCRS